jgi:hypothetical protein
VPETPSETGPEPDRSNAVTPPDADKARHHSRRRTTTRPTGHRRETAPTESYEAEPSRDERLLFMISVGLLALLAIALVAWSIR